MLKGFGWMNRRTYGIWISLLSLFLGLPLWAQSSKSKAGDVRTEKIQFDDELVEGELRKPELFYLLQKKQFNYKRLIKLREKLLPEMRRDAEKIPVGRVDQ